MATTMVASSRMVILYDNAIRKANYVGATPGNCTTASGSDINNLLDEQPATQWVSSTPTADPYVTFEHNTTLDIVNYWKYVALVNTKGIIHTYSSVKVLSSNTAGSGYTTLGEADLSGTALGLATKADYDLIFKLPASSNQKYLRFTFVKGSAWTPITIGGLYAFQGYEVPKNPVKDGFGWRYSRPLEYRRSLGGIRHIARGTDAFESSGQYSFQRVSQTQKLYLLDIVKYYGRRPCGIIDPDQATLVMPTEGGHKIVNLISLSHTPQPGDTSTTPVYDLTLEASGVY